MKIPFIHMHPKQASDSGNVGVHGVLRAPSRPLTSSIVRKRRASRRWRHSGAIALTLCVGVALFPEPFERGYEAVAWRIEDIDDTLDFMGPAGDRIERWASQRLDATHTAWAAAPGWPEAVLWSAEAAWSGTVVVFDQTPVVLLERNPAKLENQVIDALYSVAANTVAAGTAGWACIVIGDYVSPGLGQTVAPLCAQLGIALTTDLRRSVHRDLFGRSIDPDAEMVGAIVGSIAGAYVTMRLVEGAAYGSYVEYEYEARRLTEATMQTRGHVIDPQGLRGATHHLDHMVPVRCGYMLSIPPGVIAAAWNLRILTAQANMALGARGCAG